jgi:hypothetical protein
MGQVANAHIGVRHLNNIRHGNPVEMPSVGAAERCDLLILAFSKRSKDRSVPQLLQGANTVDRKKVISVWFFCHLRMVTFASSSARLRLNVAPSRSFT